jgi:CheY-like chemotaxis protein
MPNSIDTGAVTARLQALTFNLPRRILVVDDDDLERALITDRLERVGFEIVQAGHGQEALHCLAERIIPLVIVDWQMPHMSGIEFTEKVRASGMHDLYVLMRTAEASTVVMSEVMRRGWMTTSPSRGMRLSC